MGIFGEFRVLLPKNNLRNMKKGMSGYIFSTDFLISKSMLCIPLNTEVFYSIEDVVAVDRDNYVAIYKLEDGITYKCFDIDLGEDPEFIEREWKLVPNSITQQLSKSGDWICFPNPPIFFDEGSFKEGNYFHTSEINADVEKKEQISDSHDKISQLDIEKLYDNLKEAVENEEYEEAAKIRDELYKRTKKE